MLASLDLFTLPQSYEQRTGGVRALWVVGDPSALHTDQMTGTTAVTTFVMGAVGFNGTWFVSVFRRVGSISAKDSREGENEKS